MNLFSKYATAVGIALTMGVAVAATPAQAQSFGFQVSPPDSNFSFGFNVGRPDRPDYRPNRCISQRAIDDAIEDQGYRRVRITDYGRRTTEARGTRGGWVYDLTVASCTGDIIDRDRVRRS